MSLVTIKMLRDMAGMEWVGLADEWRPSFEEAERYCIQVRQEG